MAAGRRAARGRRRRREPAAADERGHERERERELDEAQRGTAQQVLLDRFAQGKENMSAHNRKVVNTLLGLTTCALHCHRANCELGRAELGRFGCALGMIGGRCVAAAVLGGAAVV